MWILLNSHFIYRVMMLRLYQSDFSEYWLPVSVSDMTQPISMNIGVILSMWRDSLHLWRDDCPTSNWSKRPSLAEQTGVYEVLLCIQVYVLKLDDLLPDGQSKILSITWFWGKFRVKWLDLCKLSVKIKIISIWECSKLWNLWSQHWIKPQHCRRQCFLLEI